MKVEIPFVSCLLLVILQINIAFARLRAADESREDEDEEGRFYDANDGAGAARSPGRKLPAGSAYINIYSPAYGDTYSQNEAIDVDWTYSSDSGSYVYLYIVSLLHRPH